MRGCARERCALASDDTTSEGSRGQGQGGAVDNVWNASVMPGLQLRIQRQLRRDDRTRSAPFDPIRGNRSAGNGVWRAPPAVQSSLRCSGCIRRKKHARVNVSTVCIGDYVGLEEIDDGVWDVYFGPLRLGRLHDRFVRIEDAYGRLRRRSTRRTTEG